MSNQPPAITSDYVGEDLTYQFVDDWLDQTPMFFGDKAILNYVHFMLSYFRLKAAIMISHKPFMDAFKLFVTYEGKRYRVTGTSSLGDVFLQPKFEEDSGYTKRVQLNFAKLTHWGNCP